MKSLITYEVPGVTTTEVGVFMFFEGPDTDCPTSGKSSKLGPTKQRSRSSCIKKLLNKNPTAERSE